MQIIFVCTGNTCRSPMAQVVAQKLAPNVTFKSAGISVVPFDKVATNSVEAIKEIGLDISNHKPTQLNQVLINEADYIIPMNDSHAQFLIDEGVPKEKIYLLDSQVPDPFGSDINNYKKTRDLLTELIREALIDLEIIEETF